MQPEKLFVRSRGLWAAAIPLIVAIASASGIDTEDLAGELDRLGEIVVLLVASVLALWSRFRPDGARLRVAPKLPPSGPLGAVVVALVLWTGGCALILALLLALLLAVPAAALDATLSWTPASGPVTGYVVEQSTDGGAWEEIARTADTQVPVTIAEDATAIWRVYAHDAGGRAGPRSLPSRRVSGSEGGEPIGQPGGVSVTITVTSP